jgi:hypothetical protein
MSESRKECVEVGVLEIERLKSDVEEAMMRGRRW